MSWADHEGTKRAASCAPVLFGTFAAPPSEEPLRFGLKGRAPSNNPFVIALGEWRHLIVDAGRADGLRAVQHSDGTVPLVILHDFDVTGGLTLDPRFTCSRRGAGPPKTCRSTSRRAFGTKSSRGTRSMASMIE